MPTTSFESGSSSTTSTRTPSSAHRGIELDVQGDGFLLAFADPLAGLDCAVGIERELATYSTEHPEHPVCVRIGLHIGEAIRDTEGFFGKTVIVAARVAAQARGGEILVSDAHTSPPDSHAPSTLRIARNS